MKKLSAIFICTIYLLSCNMCFAANNLYFLKNTDKNTVSSIVESAFANNKKYTLTKKNPYLAIQNKNAAEYELVILQTSSNNLFYYYQSSSGEKTDKAIKKLLKNNNIVFEQSQNSMYLATFENQAQKVLTNTQSNYTFEEDVKTSTAQNIPQQKQQDNKVLKGYVGQVAKGATFNTYLDSPINTATANVGDSVRAILTENWVYNGNIIAPQGSVVSGQLKKARHATYGSRNGRVVIDFNSVQTPEGKVYDISVEEIDFTVTNDGKLQSTVANVAKGAVIGALCGVLIGLLNSNASVGTSTAISAGIGAGTALAGSAVEKGIDAEIPTYTELELTLKKPLSVVLSY